MGEIWVWDKWDKWRTNGWTNGKKQCFGIDLAGMDKWEGVYL
jgi:hypothetical protein